MPRSQLSDSPLAKMLQDRFEVGRPTREAFVAQILAYFEELPIKDRGRTNRTIELHSIRKNTRRWLKGKVPQESMRPAIAKALGEPEEYVAKLCTPQRDQQASSVYRFASPPLVVIAAWPLEDGTLTPHRDDQGAFETLQRDIDMGIGVGLGAPMLSTEPGCPTSYTDRDLILISGPSRNTLAAQLNSFITKSDLSAFYFASVTDIPTPELNGNDWIITHTKIGLRVILPRDQSRANKEDYGIIYVGSNPESSEHYLIWLAGLHSRGTIGAVKAFLEPEVENHIREEFSRGKKYVSAIVRFDWSKDPSRRSVDVLYA
jgi:hypothetical protein